jgi:hypothetical protein
MRQKNDRMSYSGSSGLLTTPWAAIKFDDAPSKGFLHSQVFSPKPMNQKIRIYKIEETVISPVNSSAREDFTDRAAPGGTGTWITDMHQRIGKLHTGTTLRQDFLVESPISELQCKAVEFLQDTASSHEAGRKRKYSSLNS